MAVKKKQNEYTGHVSISNYFLMQFVLRSKNSLNCFTTFGSSVSQGIPIVYMQLDYSPLVFNTYSSFLG